MLERIIRTSSNPGDTVMDCYAGSGSALLTAARTDRFFVGMENSPAAFSAITKQFRQRDIDWKDLHTKKEVSMTQNRTLSAVDFDRLERQINLANLDEMYDEIIQRSDRLQTRVAHFADRSGIPEEQFWSVLRSEPDGPLAAVLACEARRQNVHVKFVAEHLITLNDVDQFRKLPSTGPNACYVDESGIIVTGTQLGRLPRPSKPLDFQWKTGGITCYAAQRYTKEGGGNQDKQYREILALLSHFQKSTAKGIALFALVDGPYYNSDRLAHLRNMTRFREPRSYVTSVNELQTILSSLAGHC